MTKPATILIADDDRAIRTVLNRALSQLGHDVRSTGAAAQLWQWVAQGDGDLVITDVFMPDGNGLDLLPRIRAVRPKLRVLVMSAQSTLMTAVRAAEKGAFEYLPKPFDLNELLGTVEKALNAPGTPAAAADDPMPAGAGSEDLDTLPLIGRSAAMQEIYRVLARLMGSDLTVMLNGESGTGKELVARALHDYGKRADAPFVAINMAAIARDLIESELFGHERGAFTGAAQRYAGRFEQARGGTLFLDEIGDMPLEAQTRLLRVLQEGEFTTVGGRKPIKANVRIVAATHRDLRQLVRQGIFREDLFYRLNVVPIRLPPLRERKDDLPALVRHFFEKAAVAGAPPRTVDERAMARLRAHNWPGNVRELENLIQRLAVLYPDEVIGADAIQAELSDSQTAPVAPGNAQKVSLGEAVANHVEQLLAADLEDGAEGDLHGRLVREVERPLIELTLAATMGNQIKAARVLGLNRNTLRKKIRELDIEVVRKVI